MPNYKDLEYSLIKAFDSLNLKYDINNKDNCANVVLQLQNPDLFTALQQIFTTLIKYNTIIGVQNFTIKEWTNKQIVLERIKKQNKYLIDKIEFLLDLSNDNNVIYDDFNLVKLFLIDNLKNDLYKTFTKHSKLMHLLIAIKNPENRKIIANCIPILEFRKIMQKQDYVNTDKLINFIDIHEKFIIDNNIKCTYPINYTLYAPKMMSEIFALKPYFKNVELIETPEKILKDDKDFILYLSNGYTGNLNDFLSIYDKSPFIRGVSTGVSEIIGNNVNYK